MKKLFLFLPLAALLLIMPACSSTKPPAPAAVQGNKTIAALKDLSRMYESKNLSGFMSLISDGYKDRQAFAASIGSVFSKYETVHFTIQYTRMLIMVEERGMTKTTFNWDSDWHTMGGSLQKNGGRVTFFFDPQDGKLTSIDGKNPFIPQPAEMPEK